MKKLLFLFVFSFGFIAYSQDLYWPANAYEINTDQNSTYLIQNVTSNFSEEINDFVLGAFYINDDGELTCGGLNNWNGAQTHIAIFKDDSQTIEKDGFAEDEQINWYAFNPFDGQTYSAFTEFSQGSDFYTTNSINIVSNFQVINLIGGCRDPQASNFNPNANEEDGSCQYLSCPSLKFEVRNTGSNMTLFATPISISNEVMSVGDTIGVFYVNDSGVLVCGGFSEWTGSQFAVAAFADDSQTPEKDGFASGENIVWKSKTSMGIYDVNISTLSNVASTFAADGMIFITDFEYTYACFDNSIEGCTDETAYNYNPDANTDDGSCIPIVEACTDPLSLNYNPQANTSCTDCCIAPILGCTDPQAYNYNPLANTEDNSCTPIVYGCIDNGIELNGGGFVYDADSDQLAAFNYDPDANTDDGSCVMIIEGCTDVYAYNFNLDANTDDGTCILIIYGCTNPVASNYDVLANVDDGSCDICTIDDALLPQPFTGNTGNNMTIYFPALFFNSITLSNPNEAYIVALNETGIVVGSVYFVSPAGDSDLSTGQGTLPIWGDDSQTPQVDGALANENITLQLVDGNILYDLTSLPISYVGNGFSPQTISSSPQINCGPQLGCMDEIACNYDDQALQDDGSCTYPGCTNSNFVEYYDQGYIAACDDGSCSIEVENLGIVIDNFQIPLPTGNNMTIGFDLNHINGLEGATIAAFYDLNGDGIINTDSYSTQTDLSYSECIGLTEFSDEFFTMALWGDDASTDQLDGLPQGESELIFALLSSTNQVIAFDVLPEYSGYQSNGMFVVSDINFDVTIYGCTNSNYCNYNYEAEVDDGSCMGIPGCMSNFYVEYNEDAGCNLQELCLTTWEQAFNSSQEELQDQINQNNTLNATNLSLLDSLFSLNTGFDLLLDQNNTLNATNLSLLDSVFSLNAELDLLLDQNSALSILNMDLTDSINIISDEVQTLTENNILLNNQFGQCNDELSYWSSPIIIDISPGWNIIGYTRKEAQDVVATLADIVESILIVKDNAAEVYWPEFGFNGIGDFIPGQGYQIKVNQAINSYSYPDVGGQRMELFPTVPQWVIDMDIEQHPNDIRTLVKVVDLLGQEVDPSHQIKGTPLIYLYNDATVEKKLVR